MASALRCAAQTELPPPPQGTPPFEYPPTLNASEILQPDYQSGRFYKMREPVPTYSGANRYTMDSGFGVFEANGNILLTQRIREINAIAGMREISKTDEFRSAVKAAAKSPLVIGQQLVANPVETLSGVPKGIWKFMNRAGQGIKEAGQGREKSQYEDSTAQSMIGFSKVKRKIALEFGVDPYSTNSVFQEELNGIAWASFAGQMAIKGAFTFMTGGASMAIGAVTTTGALNDTLRDKSPADLRLMNLGKLEKMGVSKSDADAFLKNTALSPTHQTAIVFALQELSGVSGRAKFIKLAGEAEDETDALFFMGTAALISKVQKDGAQITRITTVGGLPVCLAKDGTVIVALQWDYAAWTPQAGKFAQTLNETKFTDFKPTAHRIVITGDASPAIQQAMKALGVRFDIRQATGPLK